MSELEEARAALEASKAENAAALERLRAAKGEYLAASRAYDSSGRPDGFGRSRPKGTMQRVHDARARLTRIEQERSRQR